MAVSPNPHVEFVMRALPDGGLRLEGFCKECCASFERTATDDGATADARAWMEAWKDDAHDWADAHVHGPEERPDHGC